MSLKASDGAGVVFSLASSGPDGRGSSRSSPRCIWQQLLFTAGYCTSLSLSLSLLIWKKNKTLWHRAGKVYPTFSHAARALAVWPRSRSSVGCRCATRCFLAGMQMELCTIDLCMHLQSHGASTTGPCDGNVLKGLMHSKKCCQIQLLKTVKLNMDLQAIALYHYGKCIPCIGGT